jgi:hypothetical protein
MNPLERRENVYFYNCIWKLMTTLAYVTELMLNVTTPTNATEIIQQYLWSYLLHKLTENC